jgi:rod shape-determining protein MreD
MKLIFDKPRGKRDVAMRYLKYAITALLLSVAHVVFLNFIAVGGITPDLLLILCVWIALVEGPMPALFAGFTIGLLFDVISSDVIGTNALAKTVAVFIAGWFYREGTLEHKIGRFRFLLVVLISSIFHNLIYFFFYIRLSEMSYFSFFFKYGIAISSYTTVFAIFAMLFRLSRKDV